MKPARILFTLLFIAGLLLSGCAPKQIFTFPASVLYATEGRLESPYTNLPNTLTFGKTHECLMYTMPELAPTTAEVLAHYQAEMEKQGWQGDPSELNMTDEKLIASWVTEKKDAGVMVIYTPELWIALVCIGNP